MEGEITMALYGDAEVWMIEGREVCQASRPDIRYRNRHGQLQFKTKKSDWLELPGRMSLIDQKADDWQIATDEPAKKAPARKAPAKKTPAKADK